VKRGQVITARPRVKLLIAATADFPPPLSMPCNGQRDCCMTATAKNRLCCDDDDDDDDET